jgi:hypothetical protein
VRGKRHFFHITHVISELLMAIRISTPVVSFTPTMPFFPNAKDVQIKKSKMFDVNGDMNYHDHSQHISNVNSGNTTTHNISDSYNDSSRRHNGDRMTSCSADFLNHPSSVCIPGNTYTTYVVGRKSHSVRQTPFSGSGWYLLSLNKSSPYRFTGTARPAPSPVSRKGITQPQPASEKRKARLQALRHQREAKPGDVLQTKPIAGCNRRVDDSE